MTNDIGFPWLGRVLKNRREELGWSVNQLAGVAGVSRTSVYCLENENRLPSLMALSLLLAALGMDMDIVTTEEAPSLEPVLAEYKRKEFEKHKKLVGK